MLLFGTSLNGLGKKQSFIVELGPDVRATVLAAFDAVGERQRLSEPHAGDAGDAGDERAPTATHPAARRCERHASFAICVSARNDAA